MDTVASQVISNNSAAIRRVQMTHAELSQRTKELGRRNQDMGPKVGEMPHAQQMKGMTRSIEEDHDVPRATNLQQAAFTIFQLFFIFSSFFQWEIYCC